MLAFRLAFLIAALLLSACSPHPGTELPRQGDEIMVCGRLFHTGAPVVLWTDPGGYDAYRTEKRFAPWPKSAFTSPTKPAEGPTSPNRYNIRFAPPSSEPSGASRRSADSSTADSTQSKSANPTPDATADAPPGPESPSHPTSDIPHPTSTLTPEEFEQVRGGNWPLPLLQQKVDQFVLHYDVAGTSRQCFRTLHDLRGLSVHFMLDIDGTIYQTLDLKERAWHATIANDRSIGIEIANIGAYGSGEKDPFPQWYQRDPAPSLNGSVGDTTLRITMPPAQGNGGLRTPNFTGHPARPDMILGEVQGKPYRQYDFTPEQYHSLIHLAATLHTIFPQIPLDYPRDDQGRLITHTLPHDQWQTFHGILGHYHIQDNKIDPGPAMQWDLIINEARRLDGLHPLPLGAPASASPIAPITPTDTSESPDPNRAY